MGAVACDRDLVIELDIKTTSPSAQNTLRGLVIELVFYSDDGRPVLSLMNVDDAVAGTSLVGRVSPARAARAADFRAGALPC